MQLYGSPKTLDPRGKLGDGEKETGEAMIWEMESPEFGASSDLSCEHEALSMTLGLCWMLE